MAGATGQREPTFAMQRILQEGGNAVDAVIAGIIATTASLPILGSLTGVGYFMIGTPEGEFYIDAMGTHPTTNQDRPQPTQVEVRMGESVQLFNFGPSTVAPSCLLKALIYIQGRWGVKRWAEVVQPTIDFLQEGVEVTEYRHMMFRAFSKVIQTFQKFGQCFGTQDQLPKPVGDRFFNQKYVEFLQRLADNPDHRILEESYNGIGLEFEDIDFELKEPLIHEFKGHQIVTTSPPNAAGLIISYCLQQLEPIISKNDSNTERCQKLAHALKQGYEMRRNRLDGHLHEAGIQSSILGNTEHFSITDTLGFSVSATISNGASSGIFCEKSGILFNNILGEPDLNPNGFMVGTPGQRFPSGMAPTFIKKDGEIIYILGSSGSDRIRTSLVNIIVNLIIDELTIEEAIEKGRVHYDGRNLYLECQNDEELRNIVEEDVVMWNDKAMYFGGAHAVSRISGILRAKGDARRSGESFLI